MTLRSPGRGRSVTLLLLALAVIAALVPSAVLGHAELESSDPADGAVLTTQPEAIVLTFTEALDPAKSSATLHDAAGAKLVDGVVGVPDDTGITIDPPELLPGAYEIRWTSAAERRSPRTGHDRVRGHRSPADTHAQPDARADADPRAERDAAAHADADRHALALAGSLRRRRAGQHLDRATS